MWEHIQCSKQNSPRDTQACCWQPTCLVGLVVKVPALTVADPCLVGLVVKVPALRVEDPGFDAHLCQDFSRSHVPGCFQVTCARIFPGHLCQDVSRSLVPGFFQVTCARIFPGHLCQDFSRSLVPGFFQVTCARIFPGHLCQDFSRSSHSNGTPVAGAWCCRIGAGLVSLVLAYCEWVR